MKFDYSLDTHVFDLQNDITFIIPKIPNKNPKIKGFIRKSKYDETDYFHIILEVIDRDSRLDIELYKDGKLHITKDSRPAKDTSISEFKHESMYFHEDVVCQLNTIFIALQQYLKNHPLIFVNRKLFEN